MTPFLLIALSLIGPQPGPLTRVTAYCPCRKCCGRWADGITASGKPVTFNGGRFVAAPRGVPFGTMVTIPGYGTVPVLDRGGAIKGNRIDVFFPTHRAALAWGVRNLRVRYWRRAQKEMDR